MKPYESGGVRKGAPPYCVLAIGHFYRFGARLPAGMTQAMGAAEGTVLGSLAKDRRDETV